MMIKSCIKIVILFLCLAVCIPMAISCGNLKMPDEMPDDFNFFLAWGIEGRNAVDTYNGTLRKDLIVDGTETIDFAIPEEKMREIYSLILKYELYSLPSELSVEGIAQSPAPDYTLTYTYNGKTTSVVWLKAITSGIERLGELASGGTPSKNFPQGHIDFVRFIDEVRDYIYNTDEYKNMSPAMGGYA